MGTNTPLYGGNTPRSVASKFVKELIRQVKERNPQYENYNAIHVSVPAYFDLNQREDTKLAIEDAGFIVTGITAEPTAAALVYQSSKRIKGNMLILDFGGGTLDAVIFKNTPGISSDVRDFYRKLDVIMPKMESVLEIIDITGDNRLGGDDIDIVAAEVYLRENGLKKKDVNFEEVVKTAEFVKKVGTPLTTSGGKQMLFRYVEEATLTVYKRIMEIVDVMLSRNNIPVKDCILCGGSTKSDIIRNELAKRFNLSYEIDPDLAVGVGNSIKNQMDSEHTGHSIVNRLAKGIGIMAAGKVKYLADKGNIIPIRSVFSARNAKPFDTSVSIQLYQGDRFVGDHVHISTVELKDIEGHDKDGYVNIVLELVVTSEGAISLTVSSGTASIKTKLNLSDSPLSEQNDVDSRVHPNAKLYKRFAKSALHYNVPELTAMVEEYKNTGEHTLAKSIMMYMGQLADGK